MEIGTEFLSGNHKEIFNKNWNVVVRQINIVSVNLSQLALKAQLAFVHA